MQLPTFLPTHLQRYQAFTSEDTLFEELSKTPKDLLLFFESISEDETWSEKHGELLRKLIDWLTLQLFHQNLPIQYLFRTSKVLHAHYRVLAVFTPQDLTIELKDAVISINSLLISAASEFFNRTALDQCRRKESNIVSLKEIPYSLFQLIEEFVNKGSIEQLWKKEVEELFELIAIANIWGFFAIVNQCERMIKKYITLENVFDYLFNSQLENLAVLKNVCVEFINDLNFGIKLLSNHEHKLTLIFENFSERALEQFNKLIPLISGVGFLGKLIEDPLFIQIIEMSPHLTSVDLRQSEAFHSNLHYLPKNITALSLAECPWLTFEYIQKFHLICPQLTELSLAGNLQLDFIFWGELLKFNQLKKLDLSVCYQLTNDDLSIIMDACPHLTSLTLKECTKITERGFYGIAEKFYYLAQLNLSSCRITDKALIEIIRRCSTLQNLDLSYCETISAKGIISAIKFGKKIIELNLFGCHVQQEIENEIHEINPYLHVDFNFPK